MDAASALVVNRRAFLRGGGELIVSFSLFGRSLKALAADAEGLPHSLRSAPFLDSWIRIDANNAVTVFTGKAEIGQGIRTALIQIAAEELEVLPATIQLVTADTGRTPNE